MQFHFLVLLQDACITCLCRPCCEHFYFARSRVHVGFPSSNGTLVTGKMLSNKLCLQLKIILDALYLPHPFPSTWMCWKDRALISFHLRTCQSFKPAGRPSMTARPETPSWHLARSLSESCTDFFRRRGEPHAAAGRNFYPDRRGWFPNAQYRDPDRRGWNRFALDATLDPPYQRPTSGKNALPVSMSEFSSIDTHTNPQPTKRPERAIANQTRQILPVLSQVKSSRLRSIRQARKASQFDSRVQTRMVAISPWK